MQTWLWYGIFAALFWGANAVVNKVLTSDKYFKVGVGVAGLLMVVGILAVILAYFLIQQKDLSIFIKVFGIFIVVILAVYVVFVMKKTGSVVSFPIIALGILQGLLWGSGMVLTFLAFQSGADASRLVPIYNSNTIVAVLLSILFLGELPLIGDKIKVFIGALLVVIGGVLAYK